MDIAATVGFLALVIIGILIILLILKVIWMLIPAAIIAVIWMLIPAAIIAIIVYFLTYNLWYAGVAFLVIAVITVLAGILRR